MKILIQRVKKASVSIENEVVGTIDKGLLLFVGFTHDDNEQVIEQMAKKCVELRIFNDDNNKINLSLLDIGGEILSISQFTLYANCLKGRRPSFEKSEKPDSAVNHYNYFNEYLRRNFNIIVQEGVFGEDMKISLINDGPLTIILDSEEIIKKNKN